MILECVVLKEWKDRPYKTKAGAEVHPHVLTCIEVGESPMLQMVDYTLKPEELALFGTLHGKRIRLKVESFRGVFGTRARLDATLLTDGKAPVSRNG